MRLVLLLSLYLIPQFSLSEAMTMSRTLNVKKESTSVVFEQCLWLEGRSDPYCTPYLQVSPRKWDQLIATVESTENPYVGDSAMKSVCASLFVGGLVILHGPTVIRWFKKSVTRRDYLRLIKGAGVTTVLAGLAGSQSFDSSRLQAEAIEALELFKKVQALELKLGEKVPMVLSEKAWWQLDWLVSLEAKPWTP
jgi:hypothetical protein